MLWAHCTIVWLWWQCQRLSSGKEIMTDSPIRIRNACLRHWLRAAGSPYVDCGHSNMTCHACTSVHLSCPVYSVLSGGRLVGFFQGFIDILFPFSPFVNRFTLISPHLFFFFGNCSGRFFWKISPMCMLCWWIKHASMKCIFPLFSFFSCIQLCECAVPHRLDDKIYLISSSPRETAMWWMACFPSCLGKKGSSCK